MNYHLSLFCLHRTSILT